MLRAGKIAQTSLSGGRRGEGRGSKPIVKNMSPLFSLNLRNFLIDIFSIFLSI